MNSHEEQREAQRKLRNEMKEDVGRMSTKELGLGNSGGGGCGMDIADAKAKLTAKRRLQNTLSDASSAGSEAKAGPLAALGGSACKPRAKKRANKDQDDHLSLSPDGADISNMQIDEDEGLDNPKTKPAQTFLKTAMSKLAEVKLTVQAFRNVVKVSAIDEVALTNCVRALSGKTQKIQAMQLVHCLGQYKQWINRIRAIMVLVKGVNKFLHRRNAAGTKWIAKLSACPELKATFATFDAAKALAHGVEFQIPKCLSVMRASAEFHLPTNVIDKEGIERVFARVVDTLAAAEVKPQTEDSKVYSETVRAIVVDCCVALVQMAQEESWEISKLKQQLGHILTYSVFVLKIECERLNKVGTCILRLMTPSGCATAELATSAATLSQHAEKDLLASTICHTIAGQKLIEEAQQRISSQSHDETYEKQMKSIVASLIDSCAQFDKEDAERQAADGKDNKDKDMDTEAFASRCCLMTRMAKEVVMTARKLSSGVKEKIETELTLSREKLESRVSSQPPQCRSVLTKFLAEIQGDIVTIEKKQQVQQQLLWIQCWIEFAEAVAKVEAVAQVEAVQAVLGPGSELSVYVMEAQLWSTGWFAVEQYVSHAVDHPLSKPKGDEDKEKDAGGAEADSDKDTKEPKQPERPKGDAEKTNRERKLTTPSLSVACPCSPTVSKPPKMH